VGVPFDFRFSGLAPEPTDPAGETMSEDFVMMIAVLGVTAAPLFAITSRLGMFLWYRFKRAELEIRKQEMEARLVQTKLLTGAPDWLDTNNPIEVEAWQSAAHEVTRSAILTRRLPEQ